MQIGNTIPRYIITTYKETQPVLSKIRKERKLGVSCSHGTIRVLLVNSLATMNNAI